MKTTIALFLCSIIISTVFTTFSIPEKELYSTPPPAQSGSTEELWGNIMFQRMNVIEKKFGIFFDAHWRPVVHFNIPGDILDRLDHHALYDQKSHGFLIATKFRKISLPSMNDSTITLDESIRCLLDHELGHALVDQISHRLTGNTWPDTTLWNGQYAWARIPTRVLSEGMGDYFRNMLSNDTTSNIECLPDGPESELWKFEEWKYAGGYWLVKPILEKYGERGIEYIINHKLTLLSYDVQSDAIAYQQTALKELAKNNSSNQIVK